MPPILKIRNAAETEEKRPEILLYGDVGYDWAGFTDVEVADALRQIGKVDEIGVRINSLGGDIGAGLAIYNLLRAHGAKIVCDIDGYACSSAATIAMCGDTIRMGAGAVMMIHKPTVFAYGESDELRKQADVLDLLQQQIAGIYAARAGKTRDEMSRLMDAETWLTGEEAKEMGLATEVVAGNGPGEPDVDEQEMDNRLRAGAAAGRFRNVPARLARKWSSDEKPSRDAWRRNLARRRLELFRVEQ